MRGNMLDASDEEYEKWFLEQTGLSSTKSGPSEENLAILLTNAMRAYDPVTKAKCFLDLANMAMSMADKSLGSQEFIATTVSLCRH